MTDNMDKLEKRGIADTALANGWRAGQWTTHNDDGSSLVQDGWYAPLFDCTGNPLINRKRGKPLLTWKNADSAGDPHDSWCNYIEGFKPLMLPKNAIVGAVKRADGRLNLCEGKADTLSMWSAKIGNAIGIFGASMIPTNLLEQFQQWGVTVLRIFVHPDEAGAKSAQRIADLLHGEIKVKFYALPTLKDGSKIDVNDFWVHSFNPQMFRTALSKLPEKHFEARPLKTWQPAPTQPTDIPLPRIQAYANAALTRIISDLLVVTSARNIALNNAACKVGNFVGAGAIEQGRAENELIMAGVSIGLGERATRATVRSGLNAGIKNPIDLSKLTTNDRRVPQTTVRVIDTANGETTTDTAEPDQVEKLTNVRTSKSFIEARRKEKRECNASDTLPMPFQTVVQKGGFASAFKRGKTYAFIADSGAGKSSMIETIIDFFMQRGYSGVIYTPEWTGDEWVMGATQRLGGPSYMQQVAHDARTVTIDNDQEREYQAITDRMLDKIASWPGELYFIEQAIDPCSEDIILGMDAAVLDAEAKGHPLAFAVIDYAQMFLSGVGKTELEQMNRALYQFKKKVCIRHDLVGLVGSQITKEAGQANGRPSHTGMMGARSDAFNFAAFIVRERDTDDSYKPDAWLHVVKNSRGKLGKAEIFQHPETMAWHSGRWNPRSQPALKSFSEPVKEPLAPLAEPASEPSDTTTTNNAHAALVTFGMQAEAKGSLR